MKLIEQIQSIVEYYKLTSTSNKELLESIFKLLEDTFYKYTDEEKKNFLLNNLHQIREIEIQNNIIFAFALFENSDYSINNEFFESKPDSYQYIDFNKLSTQNKKRFLDLLVEDKNRIPLIQTKVNMDFSDLNISYLNSLLDNNDLMTGLDFNILKFMSNEKIKEYILNNYATTRLYLNHGFFITILDSKLSDNEKSELLKELLYKHNNGNESVLTCYLNILELIKDNNIKYKHLDEDFVTFSKIDKDKDFESSFIFATFKNADYFYEEHIDKFLKKYNNLISSYDIKILINDLPDEKRKTMFEIYKDKISESYFALYEYLKELKDDNEIIDKTIEFKTQLKSKDILNLFYKVTNTDCLLRGLNNSESYIKGKDLFDYIFDVKNKKNDTELARLLLERYFYKFDKELNYIYNTLRENNEASYQEVFNKMILLDKESLKSVIIFQKQNLDIFNSFDKINKSIDIILRLKDSNSSEIRHISSQLGRIIFETSFNEWDSFTERIEDIFLKNNIPYVGKIFKVFEIMHPDGIIERTKSPNLNSRVSKNARNIIIFSDLLKCSLGSNNRSINEYIKNLNAGDKILSDLITGNRSIDTLNDEEREVFTIFVKHLNTLYNNTLYGKQKPRELKNNLVKDSYELLSLFLKNERENFKIGDLPDRIVKMFSHFAGIDSVSELIDYRDTIIKRTDTKNRKLAENLNFSLKKGDFIKGLTNENNNEKDFYYTFIIDILQNGSLCKEFLGSNARTDTTPLDTDLSRLIYDFESFSEPFTDKKYAAARYGPLWLVIKDDDRLNYSRETKEYKSNKLEIFETSKDGRGHYGIRTGFASSDIDYFVVDEERVKLYRIEHAIAMNGFYIPILNTEGKLIFSPKNYDDIREKMQGLSHYNTNNSYEFAPELDNFDSSKEKYEINLDDDKGIIERKRNLIANALSSVGLDISTKRQTYIDNGTYELLDTGSTGRGTNCKDDYDFDFVMRVDRDIFNTGLNDLNKKISEAFPGITFKTDKIIRDQVVKVGNDEIKIDITIIPKDDKIEYTTDECINDRLKSIKKMDEGKYNKVLENIILAKEVLKEAEAYKSKNAESSKAQGGLGGVGIENWVLQNGGSFERAARSFVETAYKVGYNFEEFKKKYIIYDFGENHLYGKNNDKYKHDEFISNNMNLNGFNKTIDALKKYLYELDNRKKEEKHI